MNKEELYEVTIELEHTIISYVTNKAEALEALHSIFALRELAISAISPPSSPL